MGISYDVWRSLPGLTAEQVAMHPESPSRPSRFRGGATGCWRLTIPGWHPFRINQAIGRHWSRLHRLKLNDCNLIAYHASRAGIPPASGPRRVHLAITTTKKRRGGDPDAYWKGLLDSLVNLRLLVNDDAANVVLDPVEFVVGREAETTIELFDLRGRSQRHRPRVDRSPLDRRMNMPKITEITVSAGRVIPHPRRSFANLRPMISMKAELLDGETLHEAARHLREQCERELEAHIRLILSVCEAEYEAERKQREEEYEQRARERSAASIADEIDEDDLNDEDEEE